MYIQLVAPRTFMKDDMARNSVYIDGAIAGTILRPEINSYSFDHHGDGVRFDRTCAAKQLFSAVVQGLDLQSIEHTYVSSVDADSVVASWIMTRLPEELSTLKTNVRFQRFVDKLDRLDNHGPAALLVGESALVVAFKLTANKRAGEKETTDLLFDKIRLFEDMFAAGTYDSESAPPPRPGTAYILSTDGEVVETVKGDVGFDTVYARGNFGMIFAEGRYTIGKLPFARVPSFKSLFPRLSELEGSGSWGGADSIGGSPLGVESSISPDEVIGEIRDWLEGQ